MMDEYELQDLHVNCAIIDLCYTPYCMFLCSKGPLLRRKSIVSTLLVE